MSSKTGGLDPLGAGCREYWCILKSGTTANERDMKGERQEYETAYTNMSCRHMRKELLHREYPRMRTSTPNYEIYRKIEAWTTTVRIEKINRDNVSQMLSHNHSIVTLLPL